MPLTKKEAKKLVKLIKANTKAQIDLSWGGSQPPQDKMAAFSDARYAQQALTEFIVNHTQDEVTT